MRDERFDVLKGFGILAVVVGHSGAPSFIEHFVYSFHMPLFFLISGLLVKKEYILDLKLFLKKRVKSLYMPFIKWTAIFILLHNVFFYCGLIDSSHGYGGSVNHLYSLSEIFLKIVVAALTMFQVEDFLGTFWFIKSLFVGGVLTLLCFSLFKVNCLKKGILVGVLLWLLAGIFIPFSQFDLIKKFGYILGYREFLAATFITIGLVIKQKQEVLDNKIIFIASLIVFVICQLVPGMSFSQDYYSWCVIPPSGLSGFIVFYRVSIWLCDIFRNFAKVFSFLGNKSFYVMMFHFLMFKPFSLLLIKIFGLNQNLLAEFPVIKMGGFYWVGYCLSSIILCLLMSVIINRISFLKIK